MRFRSFLPFAAFAVIGCSQPAPAGGAPDFGACTDAGDPAQERYGTSCLCCHVELGVAGSVAHDAGVASIVIRDRDGLTAEMSPDPYDNFFRHRHLNAPLTATITFESGEQRTMASPAPHGSCNACHGETVARVGAR